MGEQGAESLHAHIHKLEVNYATTPNRLEHIFTAYDLETAPALLSLKPEVKSRVKRKREE